MKPMLRCNKYDIGLIPQALDNANVTGRYYGMQDYRKLVAIAKVGAMAAGTTATLDLLEATDGAGAGARQLAPEVFGVATNARAVLTANEGVTSATLTLVTVLVGDEVTINGLTFTAAAVADLPNRVFSQAGTDTEDAASLVLAINHATAGVPGVTASSAAGVVTLVSSEAGEETITITDAAGTITAATLSAALAVEIDVEQLDIENDFEFVAARLTTTATTVVEVSINRGNPRWEPDQAFGAQTII